MAGSIGDEVKYVPEECHAFDRDASGAFAYTFGRKERDDKITPLTDEDVVKILRQVGNLGRRVGSSLIPIAPKSTWKATITAVNDDGTAALDIMHVMGGVTLHYNNVPYDPTKKKPGTWHKGD